jgi:hypothetical protein
MKTIEERLTELEALYDTTFILAMGHQADIESLEEMFSMITEKLGWKKLEAAVFLELRKRTALKKLEEMLISVEDKSPGYAAKLQAMIDERREKLGGTQ